MYLVVYSIVLLAISSDALLLQKIDDDARSVKTKNASAVGDIWALLVAGSNTWMNYRHQVMFVTYLARYQILFNSPGHSYSIKPRDKTAMKADYYFPFFSLL